MSKGASGLVAVGDAARRLGVAPATIQRWADQGLIRAERTLGGHRRIPVSEVLRLQEAARPLPVGPVADWIKVLISGDADQIFCALNARRALAPNWVPVAEEVASAINAIGELWESAECTIFEENLACEALRRAAMRCSDAIKRGDGARRAIILAVEGDRHLVGLSLAEILFAENGWRIAYLGEGPPTRELDFMIERLKPDLVALAASTALPSSTVKQYQRALANIASVVNFRLVFGGRATWTNGDVIELAETYTELDRLLKI